ncbi:amidase family protein, partial [Chlamydia psittaci 84-8471/1]
DQIGPLTTVVEDVALAMDVFAGKDDRDATSQKFFTGSFQEALSLEVPSLIGVPMGFLDGLRDDVKENFFASLNVLERQGSRIVEVDLNILDHAVSVYYIVASAEAATNLARFDGIRYGYRSPEAHSIEDIYSISRVQGFGKE